MYLLVLNPGSTSTKVAIYEDGRELYKKNISHSKDELAAFAAVNDQLDFRDNLVRAFFDETGFPMDRLDCIVSRGGSPPNAKAGATVINQALVDALRDRPKEPHPASLGPMIAFRMGNELNIPAYIYDPITADELNPLARIYGVKGIEYDSMCHFLNTHAQAISVAREMGRPFEELNLIVAHFGGGNSMCLWAQGHPTDVVQGDACGFSSERAGFMRSERMLQLCREHGFDEMVKYLHGKGGMVSLLGTNDLREVEKRILEGDEYALLCQQAMAYHLAKNIASIFPVTKGKVDGVVLTGGGAYWERLVNDIKERIAYLGVPVYLRPGESEMQALAEGGLRVMKGEEEAYVFEG